MITVFAGVNGAAKALYGVILFSRKSVISLILTELLDS